MAQSGQVASNLLLLARRAASVLQQNNAAALPLLRSAVSRCAFAAAGVTHPPQNSSSRGSVDQMSLPQSAVRGSAFDASHAAIP